MSDTEAPEVIDAPPGFADGTAFEATDDAPPADDPTPTLDDAPADDPSPADDPAPVAAAPAPPPPDPARGILRDLQAERQARQEAQAEAARLRGQLEGLEMAHRRGPQAPTEPTPRSAESTQLLTTMAHRLGLYTPAGEPDLVTTEATINDIKHLVRSDVSAEVTSRLEPVVNVLQQAHQQSVTQQAQQHKQVILQVGSEYGADPNLLGTILDNAISVNPELLNDQTAVFAMVSMAKGMSNLGAPAAAPASQPARAAVPTPQPNITERPGRQTPAVKPLVGIERVIAGKRGITAEKWAQNNRAFDEGMDPARGLVAED